MRMAACIAYLVTTNRYHVVMFQEKPMPGPYNPDQTFIRFKSRGHHTIGAETFEEAQVHLQEMMDNPDFNGGEDWVIRDKVLPITDPVMVLISPSNKFEVNGLMSPEDLATAIESETVEPVDASERTFDMDGALL